jgi:ABC-type glutathione transport system ATPase component
MQGPDGDAAHGTTATTGHYPEGIMQKLFDAAVDYPLVLARQTKSSRARARWIPRAASKIPAVIWLERVRNLAPPHPAAPGCRPASSCRAAASRDDPNPLPQRAANQAPAWRYVTLAAARVVAANPVMNALCVRGLVKTYKNGVQALKGIDLDVAPGDFFALLGPNGAGKTTLIGIVTSLVNKTAGRVSVFGHDIDRELDAAKACIGVVPQEVNFNMFETPETIVVNQAGFYGIERPWRASARRSTCSTCSCGTSARPSRARSPAA